MKKNTQSGFSLIELLMVVVIIGIIASMGVPAFQKGVRAADNGAAIAQMRVISSTQLSFFTTNSRFARLDELNTILGNGLGNASGASLIKARFVYEMSPLVPTDLELRNSYTVLATGGSSGGSGLPFVFRVGQTGQIVQITP